MLRFKIAHFKQVFRVNGLGEQVRGTKRNVYSSFNINTVLTISHTFSLNDSFNY